MNFKIKTKLWLLMLILFAYSVPSASALDWVDFTLSDKISGIGTTVMDEIFSNLGVDTTEMRYNVQTMNVARQKKIPPIVSITFNPDNPAPGEKVTASATPLYFLNDAKDLYFTWFLKSKNCERTGSPSETQRQKCDLNNDGRVNIEDYKIKAARIITSSNFEWEAESYSSGSDNDGYNAIMGGNDQKDKNDYCFIHDVESGDEYEIDCAHLFPDAPSHTTGDGSFGVAEEKFWHTDPNADDTAVTGNGDEANVVGLGINSFSWNYEEGDEVGVIVEGISIEPAQTNDSSYRTMWAATKGLCGELSVNIHGYPDTSTRTISQTPDTPLAGQTTTVTETATESLDNSAANIARIETTTTTTTTVTDTVTGVQVSQTSSSAISYSVQDISSNISISGISSATDLNDCLYDSLISPAEGGGASERLDVSLSYSPQSPINDPSSNSGNGDELVIHSVILNTKNSNYVKYNWQVYESDEANPDSWGSSLLKSELPDSTQSVGIGLDTFKFRLNLPNPKKYLRIKLNVTENVSAGIQRLGNADILIPINSSSNEISVYPASVSASGELSLGSSEGCQSGSEGIICPVSKNEIIGVQISGSGLSDYLWTIDEKPFTYDSCFFSGCQEKQQINVAYFPVLQEVGSQFSVKVDAANQLTGEKISLNRTFKVVDPEVKISSANEAVCAPILLGNYIDVNGKEWPDYSRINYWALAGSSIQLKAESLGFSVLPGEYIWSVDGNQVVKENASFYGYALGDDGVLTLPPKLLGESYSVTAVALYTQSNEVKKALNQNWDVSYNQFYEKPISDSIEIVMQESAGNTAASVSGKNILASVYSSLPSYLAFLLRIVLTAFVMLVGSSFILSFFPNIKNGE